MKPSKEDLQRWRLLVNQGDDVMDKEQFIAILDLVETQQSLIDEAFKYMTQAKVKFKLTTTNSLVDDWLAKARGGNHD